MNQKKHCMAEERPVYARVVFKYRPEIAEIAAKNRTLSWIRENRDLLKTDEKIVEDTAKKLKDIGFRIVASSQYGISIAGPKALYKKVFGVDVIIRKEKILIDDKRTVETKQLCLEGEVKIPEGLEKSIKTVYIPPNVIPHAVGPMPNPGYYHFLLPSDVGYVTGANAVHDLGFEGENIKVALIDSGVDISHPHLVGYDITVDTEIFGEDTKDSDGHGTGMAANILAVAPKCKLTSIAYTDGYNEPSDLAAKALEQARDLQVDIISCSWGLPYSTLDTNTINQIDQQITDAVNVDGITVVFSVGNAPMSQVVAWPGCLEEVLSVGGVYPDQQGNSSRFIQNANYNLTASNFARSGTNNVLGDTTRCCPDICGICGLQLYGRLIVMPTQAGSKKDVNCAEYLGAYDGTSGSDGWFVASGTSAATAQVAGGVALLLSAKADLSPAEIRDILCETAIDIKDGSYSGSGEQAIQGPDSAVGHGFVNFLSAINSVLSPSFMQIANGFCPPGPHKEEIVVRISELIKGVKFCPGPVIFCGAAPIVNCPCGPSHGLNYELQDPFVGFLVLVKKKIANAWMKYEEQRIKPPEEYILRLVKEHFYKSLGNEGEYSKFPKTKAKKGSFDPKVKK